MDLPQQAPLFTAAAALQQQLVGSQPVLEDCTVMPRRIEEIDEKGTTEVVCLCSSSGDAQRMLVPSEIGNAPVGLDSLIVYSVQWGGQSLERLSDGRSGLAAYVTPAYLVPGGLDLSVRVLLLLLSFLVDIVAWQCFLAAMGLSMGILRRGVRSHWQLNLDA